MKIFLSQLFRGKTEEQIIQERIAAKIQILEKYKDMAGGNIEFIDSFIEEECPPCKEERLWYLGKSIELLADADLIIMLPGSDRGLGCNIEHECADYMEYQYLIFKGG